MNVIKQVIIKKFLKTSKTAFEPAGELKVKEHLDDVEKDQIGFLTERTKRRKQASNKSVSCD